MCLAAELCKNPTGERLNLSITDLLREIKHRLVKETCVTDERWSHIYTHAQNPDSKWLQDWLTLIIQHWIQHVITKNTHFLAVIRPDILTLVHTLLMRVPSLPWTAQSPGRDVLWSDTLGRTWMLPEMVSDAFLAKAKIGACHRPSPPPPPPPLAVLFALSPNPDFSSCSLKIPNTWPFSLLLSASDRTRSWSAGDAIFT